MRGALLHVLMWRQPSWSDKQKRPGLQIAKHDARIAMATTEVAALARSASSEAACMAAVKAAVAASKGTALHELRCHVTSPPATMHILTAILRLLRRDPPTFATWNCATRLFNDTLFADLEAYDAAQERDAVVWKGVRAAYKACDNAQAWAYEMPETGFGALLLLYIKQVCFVACMCCCRWPPACVGCCPQRGLLFAAGNSTLDQPLAAQGCSEAAMLRAGRTRDLLASVGLSCCWVCESLQLS
jgi:hypothetical protein